LDWKRRARLKLLYDRLDRVTAARLAMVADGDYGREVEILGWKIRMNAEES